MASLRRENGEPRQKNKNTTEQSLFEDPTRLSLKRACRDDSTTKNPEREKQKARERLAPTTWTPSGCDAPSIYRKGKGKEKVQGKPDMCPTLKNQKGGNEERDAQCRKSDRPPMGGTPDKRGRKLAK